MKADAVISPRAAQVAPGVHLSWPPGDVAWDVAPAATSRASKPARLERREYAAEFTGTALLLAIGLSFVVIGEAPVSPVPRWLPDADARRLLIGYLFAGTATALVYSPRGRRSGGHFNPAILRLSKITRADAAIYCLVQVAGAISGTLVARLLWGAWAASVDVGATVPGNGGGFPLPADLAGHHRRASARLAGLAQDRTRETRRVPQPAFVGRVPGARTGTACLPRRRRGTRRR